MQDAAKADELYYDPYSVELNMNPYPVFARIREEAPLYYNDKHDFYALSRFDDVNKRPALRRHDARAWNPVVNLAQEVTGIVGQVRNALVHRIRHAAHHTRSMNASAPADFGAVI